MAESENRANEEVAVATAEKPVEERPAEEKPVEEKPVEQVDEKPVEQADEKPGKQAEDKPVEDKPVEPEEAPITIEDVEVAPATDTVEEAKDKIGDVIESVSDELFDRVMKELKAKSDDIGLQPSTLPRVIGLVMEAIEETPVKGEDQRKFAVKVIDVLINELPSGDAKTLLQETSASGGIEGTIELVVLATHGGLNVNAVLENASDCAVPCCGFLSRKLRRRAGRR